jgi:hypothetical protein
MLYARNAGMTAGSQQGMQGRPMNMHGSSQGVQGTQAEQPMMQGRSSDQRGGQGAPCGENKNAQASGGQVNISRKHDI